jgi:hypothetical protein
MRTTQLGTLTGIVLLAAPAALASPPQNDSLFFVGVAGSPAANGCPASSLYGSVAENSSYGAAAASDANGDGYVCAIALPDAARDALFPAAPTTKAFYLFSDNTR